MDSVDTKTADDVPGDVAKTLPPNMTLQQASVRIAKGVCEAYAAYNNGANLQPKLAGYNSFVSIFVYEALPNLAATSAKYQTNYSRPRPTDGATPAPSNPPCAGPCPGGTPQDGSYQLFGFTATADDRSHNILVFRGTVTLDEATMDLFGWGDPVPCILPPEGKTQYGNVNSYFYGFYTDKSDSWPSYKSLAHSCHEAIQTTAQHNPKAPWLVGGHSLGGAVISIAALDGVVRNAFGTTNVTVVTFGSLHVGDLGFAQATGRYLPSSSRVANLCDFVPSMIALYPPNPCNPIPSPYVHVGIPAIFVWQTWSDWGNHSLASIYIPIVETHWNYLTWGSPTYPVKIS